MSLNAAQRCLRCLRASELRIQRGPDMGWARNLSLISRVMTARTQEDVGAKRRLGLLRESGEGGWPRFPRFRTGPARRPVEVLASPEVSGA